jgi:hypothetical protein
MTTSLLLDSSLLPQHASNIRERTASGTECWERVKILAASLQVARGGMTQQLASPLRLRCFLFQLQHVALPREGMMPLLGWLLLHNFLPRRHRPASRGLWWIRTEVGSRGLTRKGFTWSSCLAHRQWRLTLLLGPSDSHRVRLPLLQHRRKRRCSIASGHACEAVRVTNTAINPINIDIRRTPSF